MVRSHWIKTISILIKVSMVKMRLYLSYTNYGSLTLNLLSFILIFVTDHVLEKQIITYTNAALSKLLRLRFQTLHIYDRNVRICSDFHTNNLYVVVKLIFGAEISPAPAECFFY